jgi:hypothetical protein
MKKNFPITSYTSNPSSPYLMPIETTNVEFSIYDMPTRSFISHCFDNWKNLDICTDAHVLFMKHLTRSIFHLHNLVELVGIRFEDDTLAMLSPMSGYSIFFVLSRTPEWSAVRVHVNGFSPQWGLETGFWEGLNMGNNSVLGVESKGPQEDD